MSDTDAASDRRATPLFETPGRRSEAEIAAIHRFRLDKAVAWYFQAVGDTPERHCPICDYRGPFSPVRFKIGIWCPGCDSRPRHRLMQLWLKREARLGPGLRVLHFAAEPWARRVFQSAGCVYVTADLNDRYDRRLDITAMDQPDASVDLLIANHVLEHVDDRAALSEIARVLAPGGRALLTVPVIEGWDETLEAPPGADPETRRRLCGDADHRRFYGRDVRERIRAAGLGLTEYVAVEPDVSTHALQRGERLFLAEKR